MSVRSYKQNSFPAFDAVKGWGYGPAVLPLLVGINWLALSG